MTSAHETPGIIRRSAAASGRALASLGAPLWIAILVATVAAAVFVGVGGLRPASASPTEFDAGEEVRTSLYAVTVLDAETTDVVEDRFEADPGETLVVLTVRVENLSDRPIALGGSTDRIEARLVNAPEPLLALVDVEPTDFSRSWRTDGSAGGIVLQPDVPTVVQIAWPVPEGAFADGILRLDVHEPDVTTGKVIFSSDYITWQRGDLVARIRVPVEAS
ncbi:hypothetical protein [Microbacterium sp. GXF0217]